MNDVEDLNRAEEEEERNTAIRKAHEVVFNAHNTKEEEEQKRKTQALAILKLRRFPNGNPGTVIERCGRKYLVTQSGTQRRIE